MAVRSSRLNVIAARPRLRSHCANGEGIRPCPHVWCKSTMILDHTEGGGIVLNSGLRDDERGEGAARIWSPVRAKDPAKRAAEDQEFAAAVDATLEWWIYETDRARRWGSAPPPDSCLEDILDRLDDGEQMLLEEVGEKMFITRERARQIEESGWSQLTQSRERLKRRLGDAPHRRIRRKEEG